MKSIISGIAFLLMTAACLGQTDSVSVSVAETDAFLYREPIQFSADPIIGLHTSAGVLSLDQFSIKQPLIIDFNLDKLHLINNFQTVLPAFSPFLRSLSITNFSHYNLNSRLTFGGTGFSASSVFESSLLNLQNSYQTIKGASMFLQYKVSKNLKISGSIQFSNFGSPW